MSSHFQQRNGPEVLRVQGRTISDRGVGKTCLVLRFIEGLVANARQQSTIGAFFLTKR